MSFIFGKKKTPAGTAPPFPDPVGDGFTQRPERFFLLVHSNTYISCSQGAVKIMAKELIRTRHQITNFFAIKSQLQGVSLRSR
jgi:charged multivesicular body protein 2A